MEGWKMRRGGPQGWRRRADRRCSDTRRLEELLIFSRNETPVISLEHSAIMLTWL